MYVCTTGFPSDLVVSSCPKYQLPLQFLLLITVSEIAGRGKGISLNVFAACVWEMPSTAIRAEQKQRCFIQSMSCCGVRRVLTAILGRWQETVPLTLSTSR